MSDTSKLCSLCSAVVSAAVMETSIPHHSSVEALQHSAIDCWLCLLAWDQWEAFDKNSSSVYVGNPNDIQFTFKKFWYPEDNYLSLRFLVERPHDVEPTDSPMSSPISSLNTLDDINEDIILNFWAIPIDGVVLATCPTISNTGSAEVLATAAQWVDSCVRTHNKCNQEIQTRQLPARVLDVTASGDTSLVRLHVTTVNSPQLPYASLSHCWGGSSVMRLLNSNLETMQKSIDTTKLSNTFKDAIKVTRSLGLRFLWIDSLCIIQDSLEDWTAQSAVMGKIYENSICNIAATAAKDGHIGCFFKRNPLLAKPCEAIIRKLEDVKDPSSPSTSRCVVVPQYIWDSVDVAPLNKRAWVVQERILAPRTIHFCQNQLLWECRELIACEIFPNGLPKQFLNSQGLKSLDPVTEGARIRKTSSSVPKRIKEISDLVVDSFLIWNRILTAYTRCYLTRDEDKLVAISAIAKRIQPLVSGTYIAGLWEQHLPYHLLWHAWPSKYGHRSPARCKSYCAPSWSWASINGSCDFYNTIEPYQKQLMINISEAKVTTRGPDRMGQVVDGYIKLRCWLKPLQFSPNQWDGNFFQLGNYTSAMVFFDDEKFSGPGQWFFMPILENRNENDVDEIHGLILSKVDRRKFRRSGKFEAIGSDMAFFRRPLYDAPMNKCRQDDYTESRKSEPQKTDGSSLFEAASDLSSIEDLDISDLPHPMLLVADSDIASDGISQRHRKKKLDMINGPVEGDWIEAVITII